MMTTVMPSSRSRLQNAQDVICTPRGQAPASGFVEQQKSWMPGEGPGQLHQPELLVGELARRQPGLLDQPDTAEGGGGGCNGVGVGQTGAVGTDDDVVQHRQPRKAAHHLEGTTDAQARNFVHLQADHTLAGDGSGPFVGRQNPVQQIEQRGLAGSVRADNAEDFAADDFEADLADRAQAAE